MKLLIASFIALFSSSVFAYDIQTKKCADSPASFNGVTAMKTYSNGGIKVFGIDNIEPAAVPYGVVVTLDRGESLADLESFCRYIPNLSYVDIDSSQSSYSPETNTLTLKMNASEYNPETGGFEPSVLTIKVVRGAQKATDVVKAEMN